MKNIQKALYGIIAILMVSACNFGTTIVVTATPSQTPIVTATMATTAPIAATQTLSPSPTTAVRVQPTAYVPNCTVRTDWQIYYVVAGDTLGNIATRTGSTVTNLVSANCIANANSIYVGQALRVPRLPVTPTFTPLPNPDPRPIVYASDGLPPYDQCVVMMAANRAPETTPLFRTANTNESNFAFLSNWGMWVSTINGFYQITIGSGGQIINAFVRIGDTIMVGSGCNQQTPTTLTQGDVQISPHLASGTRAFDLRGGDTVTLTWANAPSGLVNANFYIVETNGSRSLLGTDNYGADGWSINWVVLTNMTGQYVIAEGSGFNSGPFTIATTIPVSLYSNTTANSVCVAQNIAPLPIYRRPGVDSEIIGELPVYTQWLVIGFASDGWIAVRGNNGWVSGSIQVTYSGTCPSQ